MNETGYSFKSDIWSVGCVLYEVCICPLAPFAPAFRWPLFSPHSSERNRTCWRWCARSVSASTRPSQPTSTPSRLVPFIHSPSPSPILPASSYDRQLHLHQSGPSLRCQRCADCGWCLSSQLPITSPPPSLQNTCIPISLPNQHSTPLPIRLTLSTNCPAPPTPIPRLPSADECPHLQIPLAVSGVADQLPFRRFVPQIRPKWLINHTQNFESSSLICQL